MATSVNLIRRYVWLIDTIRNAGRITLTEINEKWLNDKTLRKSDESGIPDRTFHRHRQAIADLFGLDIVCDRTDNNTYYIENEEVLDQPTFTSWLYNGLSLDNRIDGNTELAERIIFEESPGGNALLSQLIEAILKNRIVVVKYRRFTSMQEKDMFLEPYGLKQSGRRWYFLAKICGKDDITVFALDRIESIEITKETYELDKKIDLKNYFDEVVGVNVDDDFDCEKVVVRIFGRQRAYFESLPIHKSQKLLKSESKYSDYELTIRPEYEFQTEILRLGSSAEIISPQWLREEIQWMAEQILSRYK